MSGLLKRARPSLVNLQRAIPRSCADYAPWKIDHVESDDKRGMLKIRWNDGKEGKYPYVWLQDCAPPQGWAQNRLGVDERPLPLLAELNLEAKPESVEVLPIGLGVMVEWPPYNKVSYPASWLRRHFPCESDKTLRSVTVWNRSVMKELGGIPLVSNVQPAHEICQLLARYGVVRVRQGMLTRDKILEGLGIEPSDDFAYSTCFAKQVNDLHTGLPFCDPIPNLAVFGIAQKPSYGHLQLVDGFMMAKLMREQHPFTFRYLCTVDINYGDQDRRCEFETLGFDYIASKRNLQPVFVLKNDGFHVKRVVFSNPCRSARQGIPADAMHEFYAALKKFGSLCYDAANVINIAPEEGDLFLIDNDRVLHGTTAFDGKKLSREIQESFFHLKGLKRT